ncbi:MAG: adenylate/guanylate cyclase domain-containing protein, partial [Acidimicrobiales bacterium]
MSDAAGPTPSIDELLTQAIEAANRGDLPTAQQLAGRVLAEDASNLDAGDLLSSDDLPSGELRRLAIVFCDLVGSTALSGRLDPERYRRLVGRYKATCREIIQDRYDGHIANVKGDGVLSIFGFPHAHENDAERAVRAAWEVTQAVRQLSEQVRQAVGVPLGVRAAVHRGLVYLDPEEDDIYGLAVNVAARLQELADPGTVVISDEIRRLVAERFET